MYAPLWSNWTSLANACLTARKAVSIVFQKLTSATFWEGNHKVVPDAVDQDGETVAKSDQLDEMYT